MENGKGGRLVAGMLHGILSLGIGLLLGYLGVELFIWLAHNSPQGVGQPEVVSIVLLFVFLFSLAYGLLLKRLLKLPFVLAIVQSLFMGSIGFGYERWHIYEVAKPFGDPRAGFVDFVARGAKYHVLHLLITMAVVFLAMSILYKIRPWLRNSTNEPLDQD